LDPPESTTWDIEFAAAPGAETEAATETTHEPALEIPHSQDMWTGDKDGELS